jgi:hypothetical protein
MPRLSSKAHKALTLLASSPSGADEPLMIAHGFKRGMLDRLVFAGLATIVDETMQTGTSTIEIERYRITDDGRRARSKSDARSDSPCSLISTR